MTNLEQRVDMRPRLPWGLLAWIACVPLRKLRPASLAHNPA